MTDPRHLLGRQAEAMAAHYLEAHGFLVVGRNVRVGHLELDVIARKAGLLVFCEVRARRDDRVMTPAQSITPLKVRRVRGAAARWLRANRMGHLRVRFDVASVVFDCPNGRLRYLEGAF